MLDIAAAHIACRFDFSKWECSSVRPSLSCLIADILLVLSDICSVLLADSLLVFTRDAPIIGIGRLSAVLPIIGIVRLL